MNFSRLTAAAGLCAAMAACSVQTKPNYSLTVPVPADAQGTMAYLVDWDSGDRLDSVLVTADSVRFEGNVDDAFIARIYFNGTRGPILFIEPGAITLDADGNTLDTPLNRAAAEVYLLTDSLYKEYAALDRTDSLQYARGEALELQIKGINDSVYRANSTNPLGLYFFLQDAYELTLPQLEAEVKSNPWLANSKKVNSILSSLKTREATSPGRKYLDFKVTYADSTYSLSQYVTPGEYTLVDFWASWCGPCMRESKVIKELYSRYHGKGLNVVGVAVWDEPEATLAAIESHALPWPNIINSQTVATDLYGINAIPCILLIGPDGTIIARDKTGAELVDAVDTAMAGYTPADEAPAPKADSDTAVIF